MEHHYAAVIGNVSALQAVSDKVALRDAFAIACRNGHAELVQELLGRGVDPTYQLADAANRSTMDGKKKVRELATAQGLDEERIQALEKQVNAGVSPYKALEKAFMMTDHQGLETKQALRDLWDWSYRNNSMAEYIESQYRKMGTQHYFLEAAIRVSTPVPSHTHCRRIANCDLAVRPGAAGCGEGALGSRY